MIYDVIGHRDGIAARVRECLRQGSLKLHGWCFDIQTGCMLAYDPEFVALSPLGLAA